MDEVKDFFGEELKVGDIIVRPKFSGFTLHKILAFRKKSITLSIERREFQQSSNFTYKYIVDCIDINQLHNQTDKMYISKEKYKNGLIKIK